MRTAPPRVATTSSGDAPPLVLSGGAGVGCSVVTGRMNGQRGSRGRWRAMRYKCKRFGHRGGGCAMSDALRHYLVVATCNMNAYLWGLWLVVVYLL
jgi:hypothetical protein